MKLSKKEYRDKRNEIRIGIIVSESFKETLSAYSKTYNLPMGSFIEATLNAIDINQIAQTGVYENAKKILLEKDARLGKRELVNLKSLSPEQKNAIQKILNE
jgi:hypothetical protein